jgi:hypothetical protein
MGTREGEEVHDPMADQLRSRTELIAEITSLRLHGERRDARNYYRGALAALQWIAEGGPGPLTGHPQTQPLPAAAIVHELAAAEALIYGHPSTRRNYASGVEHALMWAQHATPDPPRTPPPDTNTTATAPAAPAPRPAPPGGEQGGERHRERR